MSQIIAPQLSVSLDRSLNSVKIPVYKHKKLLADNSSTYDLNSGRESTFHLPIEVMKFTKSRIQFDLTVNAPGANLHNTLFTDRVPILNIKLKTRDGVNIVDLSNCAAYTKTATFLTTSLEKYNSRGPVYANDSINNSNSSENMGCQPASCKGWDNDLLTEFNPTLAYIRDNGDVPSGGGPDVVDPTGLTVDTGTIGIEPVVGFGSVISRSLAATTQGVDKPYVSPQRIATGGNNEAVTMRYNIPLSSLVGTAFALDQNFYFGQQLELVIQFEPLSKWGFASEIDAITGVVALTGGILSNYALYLATDINVETAEPLKAMINAGYETLIPYSVCTVHNGIAGSAGISLKLVPSQGISIKRILTVPCHVDDTLSLSCNNDNVVGVKYSNVQSFLEGSPLQDYQLSVDLLEDYHYVADILNNTAAGISARNFYINSFHIDNFSSVKSGVEMIEDDKYLSGLRIGIEKNYTINFTTLAVLKYFTYVTYMRRLFISPNGLKFSTN